VKVIAKHHYGDDNIVETPYPALVSVHLASPQVASDNYIETGHPRRVTLSLCLISRRERRALGICQSFRTVPCTGNDSTADVLFARPSYADAALQGGLPDVS
jgi:hypothetical protein